MNDYTNEQLTYRSVLELEGATEAQIAVYEQRIDLALAMRGMGIEVTGDEDYAELFEKLNEAGYNVEFNIRGI